MAGDGTTYDLRRLANGDLSFSRNTISVVAAAASLAVAIGGTAGVAIAGAGAVAINSVTGKTNAYIANSRIVSAGAVSVTARARPGSPPPWWRSLSRSAVAATSGVGVAIGISVARNFIGAGLDGTPDPLEVHAYIEDSSISAGGALTITATAAQAISALVFAGAAAIARRRRAPVSAWPASGVWAENVIRADVKAAVDGDGANGISASSITVQALDTSTITAFAGAAALAAAFAGVGAAVAVSIGVSLARNVIANRVEAKIVNVDGPALTSEPTPRPTSARGPGPRGDDGEDVGLRGDDEDASTSPPRLRHRRPDWTQVTDRHVTIGAARERRRSTRSRRGRIGRSRPQAFVGVAVSGAGRGGAANIILTRTNAHIDASILKSTGAVTIAATDTSSMKAIIAALSLAVGAGAVGVGASIGLSLAENLIGWNPDGAARPRPRTGENVLALRPATG